MSKKAFTLIELAVVLLVIGLLAGILLRNIGGFTATARDSRRIGDLRNVSNYLSQYLLKHGAYPTSTTWDDLERELQNGGILGAGTKLPRDPLAGRSYNYSPCTTTGLTPAETAPTHYVIWAQLESSPTTAPQIFADSASGTPTDWGWTCQGTSPTCAKNNSNYCIAQ